MMQSTIARISVRSKRQAMDWSLVLVSQGIETSIEYSEEFGWELTVSSNDYGQAVEALRKYQNENRHWRWRSKILGGRFFFDWSSLAWAGLLIAFYVVSEKRENLIEPALMESVAVAKGEWWRLFTAIWLHADLAHLASNATLGAILLGLAMGRYGTGIGLLAAYLAGVGGNISSWLFAFEAHHSLGASGMVMGSLGLLAIQSVRLWRRHLSPMKEVGPQLAAGLMLFVLLGLAPGTDILAHLGGFIGGVTLGSLALLIPRKAHRHPINLFSGCIFTALVIWPWWLALRPAHPGG
jgi:membrane associated rhomboid family serine protease